MPLAPLTPDTSKAGPPAPPAFWREAHFTISNVKLRFTRIPTESNWTFLDRKVNSEIDELRSRHFQPPLGGFIIIICFKRLGAGSVGGLAAGSVPGLCTVLLGGSTRAVERVRTQPLGRLRRVVQEDRPGFGNSSFGVGWDVLMFAFSCHCINKIEICIADSVR